VIETFIIDWPILAFFGFLFGGVASRIGVLRSLIAGLISTGGFTASAMLSYKHAPDWMWMYLRDPKEMEPAVRLMPPAYVAAFLLSFVSALRMERSSVRTARAAALGAEAAVLVATWDRYHRIGTKQQWVDGTADELVAVKPEGKAKQVAAYMPLVVGTFVLGAALAWGGRATAARR
jgi:hypothetical protein